MVLLGIVILGIVAYIIVTDYLFLKKDKNKLVRMKLYKEIIATQWTMLLILCGVWLIGGFAWRDLVMLEGVSSQLINGMFVAGFLTSVIIIMIAMTYASMKTAKKAGGKLPVVGDVEYMLPQTKKERLGFLFVSATAGICEEIIFRGAVGYFLLNLPFELSLSVVAIIGGVIFGLAHYYQGWKGMISTGLFGYVIFKLYISTGSLLLPILAHFIIDAKFVFTPKLSSSREKEQTVAVE